MTQNQFGDAPLYRHSVLLLAKFDLLWFEMLVATFCFGFLFVKPEKPLFENLRPATGSIMVAISVN